MSLYYAGINKSTTESRQGVVELDRKDETLLDRANALNLPPAPTVVLKKILVPVDFSRSSKDALEFGVCFARQFGASLAILHVVEPGTPIDPYGISPAGFLGIDLTEQAKTELNNLAGEVVPPTISSQTLARGGQGQAAREIIKAAQELEADLIIISTHGRTGLQRVVFGSIAEYIVRHASCPVLTLRTKE